MASDPRQYKNQAIKPIIILLLIPPLNPVNMDFSFYHPSPLSILLLDTINPPPPPPPPSVTILPSPLIFSHPLPQIFCSHMSSLLRR